MTEQEERVSGDTGLGQASAGQNRVPIDQLERHNLGAVFCNTVRIEAKGSTIKLICGEEIRAGRVNPIVALVFPIEVFAKLATNSNTLMAQIRAHAAGEANGRIIEKS